MPRTIAKRIKEYYRDFNYLNDDVAMYLVLLLFGIKTRLLFLQGSHIHDSADERRSWKPEEMELALEEGYENTDNFPGCKPDSYWQDQPLNSVGEQMRESLMKS